MSSANRSSFLAWIVGIGVLVGILVYVGTTAGGRLADDDEGASGEEMIRVQQVTPTPTVDLVDTLTATELHWASYIYNCLGDGVQLERILVRQSTLREIFRMLGGDLYDEGQDPVWILAYVSQSPIPNDVLGLGGTNPFDPAATFFAATPYTNPSDMPVLPTLYAPYGADEHNRTVGYCAYNEGGEWVAKEIVPPVVAEHFLGEIEQLPRIP